MPDQKSPVVRLLVPLLVFAGGIALFFAVFKNTMTKPGSHPAPPAAAETRAADAAPSPVVPTLAPGDASAEPSPALAAPAPATPAPSPRAVGASEPLVNLAARVAPGGESVGTDWAPIGSLTPGREGGAYELEIAFTASGAGVRSIRLANHFAGTTPASPHEVVQGAVVRGDVWRPNAPDDHLAPGLVPMALLSLTVNGQEVFLWGPVDATGRRTGSCWSPAGRGEDAARQWAEFSTVIAEDAGAGREVARVVRRYTVTQGSFEFTIHQRVENLTDRPLVVKWGQFGPVDLPLGIIRYGGDSRKVIFGYLRDPAVFPPDVLTDGFRLDHARVLDDPSTTSAAGFPVWDNKTLWPTKASQEDRFSLSWIAAINRYFGVGVTGMVDPPEAGRAARPAERIFERIESVQRWAIAAPPGTGGGRVKDAAAALMLNSREETVAPGGIGEFPMGVYAGPLSRTVLSDAARQPRAAATQMSRAVYYNFGGPCWFCTFQPIARAMRTFMGVIHDYVAFDWALAIMALVVCVRTLLHPVTKRSQAGLIRFGKDMQKLAPKQRKLQEKYKDDPAKMREEMSRLMKEEKINYAGLLGCLPMFLQMPIWMALAPMLYFTFELRHQGAFFGVFQAITGGSWQFLADLAEPDNFVRFADPQDGFWIPLLSTFMGPINSLNLLPFVLAMVFYLQQKYLTPPSTTPLTPEQEQQQKIMKIMMVVMFPVMMYNAPSGLAIYFITNSVLAILESRYVRAHVEREDARRAAMPRSEKERKPGKVGGFLARLQQKALELERMRQEAEKRRAGPKR